MTERKKPSGGASKGPRRAGRGHRYSHAERGICAELTDETLDAVDRSPERS